MCVGPSGSTGAKGFGGLRVLNFGVLRDARVGFWDVG